MKPLSLMKYAAVATMASLIMACSSNPKVEPVQTTVEAPAPVEIINTARGPSLTLEDVQFDFEQASLRPEAASTIIKAASYLKDHPEREALVEGHTDHTGDKAYNQILSVERSRSIKDALIAQGISSKRIKTVGMGETQPVADNKTPDGRQANRRVEIIFQVAGTEL